MTFKIGDIVRLKSGGVHMCVTAYHGAENRDSRGIVSCTWLTMTGEPKSYAFGERLIVNVVDEQMNRIKAATDSMLGVSESVDRGYRAAGPKDAPYGYFDDGSVVPWVELTEAGLKKKP